MYQNLTVITQSSNPILPLALVKTHLKQDATVNTLDDQLIGIYLAAAARTAESYLKRTLATKQYKLVLDYFPGAWSGGSGHPGAAYAARNIFGTPASWSSFTLPKPPLVSVDGITFNSTSGMTSTVNPSTYVYTTGTPGRVGAAYGQVFPFAYAWTLGQIGGVQITYTAGFGIPDPVNGMLGILPENITAAILLLTANLYINRSPTNADGLALLPMGVKELFDSASPGFYR